MNAEQIARYALPTKPRKSSERRRPDLLETVEAEAMPARTLRGLLRDSLDSLLPKRELIGLRAAEQSERERMKALVTTGY